MEMSSVFDLAVVGAGPAGSAAAICGARRGCHVLQLEAGAFPRQKVCGEFISPEALELMQSLFSADDLHVLNNAPLISASCLHLDGRSSTLELEPCAVSVTRSELDHILWKSAQKHGAICKERCRVRAIARDGNLFRLTMEDGESLARAVVNCSGRWSELRVPEISSPQEKWIGIKTHFYEKDPVPSCDLYFFEGGYCGVLPIHNGPSGIVNAAAMVRADVARNFEEIFPLHCKLQERSRQWRPLFAPVTTAPLVFFPPQTSYDGVLLAGDAAGFIDPFTGDGISLAIHSGMKAATLLCERLQGGWYPQETIEAYDLWYRKNLLPAFSIARRLRSILRLPRFIRRGVMTLLQAPLVGSSAIQFTRARTLLKTDLLA